MDHDFTSAMRRASELVRAGNPAAATELIQSSLKAQGSRDQPFTGMPSGKFEMPNVGHIKKGRGLGETLADLAASMPVRDTGTTGQTEPDLRDGARFDHGTFSGAAGQRAYRVYVPGGKPAQRAGLIMMLHGCTQSPADFANGTDMNRLAQEHNLIVVYPAQSRGANMQSCWNWFGPTDQERGAGEPAILAGLALKLQQDHNVPKERIFVAGLSAGAAMAVILGRTYPEIFAAVGAHSGLPYKSASDVATAFAAMNASVPGSSRTRTTPTPTIVFHGTTDQTVNSMNGQRIADEARPTGTEVLDNGARNGRTYARTTVVSDDGHAALEHWRIDGLGHAWSGGNRAGSYTDPAGPDASAEMVRFFLNLRAEEN